MMYPFLTMVEETKGDLEHFGEIVRNNAHLILEFSQKGGVLNAANL